MSRPRLARAATSAIIATLLASPLCFLPAIAAEVPPADNTLRSASSSPETDQFIVKFRDMARTESAVQGKAFALQEEKLGIDIAELRTGGTGSKVVKTNRLLNETEAETLVAGLEADPAVEYAEPDTIMHSSAFVPDDSFYGLQWDLSDPQYGLGMTEAWKTTAGEGVTVAVVDTGIVSHSDLDANVLPGYDMISDAAISRDGDGRDANARDEGDYGDGIQCEAGSSSWHGTHAAGTIAAVGGNNAGVTGAAPASKLVPVRALGVCGSGYTSDVIDGITWASGGSVPGAPINHNPSKVINLSLGGSAACSTSFQYAIDQAVARGSVVVAAAGNEARDVALSSPANCENVISVGSTGRSGNPAYYSNYGAGIDVSAPGGDASFSGSDTILSTVNSGAASPIEDGTGDSYGYMQGTSMAAPHVSAVAALMLAVSPGLTPVSVEELLEGTTKPTASFCWNGCGTGIVDATAAVKAAVDGTLPQTNQVTPAPVVFVDKDGVADDTYTVPSVEGVDYFLDGAVVASETYPGTGYVAVTAKAQPDYVLSGDVTEWSHTFDSSVPQTDTAAPVLVSSSVDKTEFNLNDGDAIFTVSVHTTDTTGTIAPYINVNHDGTAQSAGFGRMTLASGTANDGTWTRTVTIPQGSAPGQWEVTLYPLEDTLGNSTTGYPIIETIIITAPESDTAAPVLVSSSVDKTEFNLNDGDAIFTVSVHTTDTTGTIAPYINVNHDGTAQSAGFGRMTLASGTANDGTWTRTVTIPQGSAPGQWEVTLYPLEDTLGNSTTGYPIIETIIITAPESDTAAPVLVSSSVDKTEFNLNDGDAIFTVSVHTTDTTGTIAPYINVNHDGTAQSAGFGRMTLASGTANDGTWTRTVTIPQGSAPGQWEVTLYPLEDTLGNSTTGYPIIETINITDGPTPVEVSPAPVVFTDKDGTAEDTYTIPTTKGVDYLLADQVIEAGTHPGSGTVTVTARAQTDYVLTGDVTEWAHTFKVTPHEVTAAPVVFTDKDGTAEDTYTIPTTKGVDYLLGDQVIEAGTHPGSGTVTVTARAQTDYVLTGDVTEWAHTFKVTPHEVTAAPVVFTDKDGTAEDTYTIPTTKGVDYLLGDQVIEAGTHPGSGTVTVTARAQQDYVLTGDVTEWAHTFKVTPHEVSPAPVVFTDKDGTAEDTYTIPTTKGVDYLLGDQVIEAGTHPGSGTVTVTARAQTDYVLTGDVTEWAHTFKVTPHEVSPAPVVFTDKDGTAEDTYTIPTTKGVDYLLGDQVIEAGTHPGSGTVTVTARAQQDYVLTGDVTEWAHTFKVTPHEVTAAPVVFTDKDGTAEDTYTIPTTKGVDYLLGDQVIEAGTHPGSGTVTVTARAQQDYVLTGDVTEWAHTFKVTPHEVTAAPVVFTDKDGTAEDTYTIPTTKGVDYLLGDQVIEAGTHPGSGTVTVTARAQQDYVLTGDVTEWAHTFKVTPHEVTAAPVVFTDKDGTAEDTYTIPTTKGVDYLLGDQVIEAGTHPGSGTVTVTARAQQDYVLTGDVTEWAHTFKVTPHEVTAAPVVFTDKDGTAEDTYTIPTTKGVDYLLGDQVIEAGTHPGSGTVTVTARAQADYVLTGTAEWAYTFATTPHQVSGVRVDFDGDGNADVIGRDSAGRLWLYPGNGKGGWGTRTQIGSGWQGFTSIFSPGDLNGDTHTDVIGRDSAGRLWLYPGNGKGGWGTRTQIGSGWQGFTSIFSPGDFNGDTHTDVIGRDSAGRLWLYPGNGKGGWGTRTQIGSGWQGFTSIFSPGDFNGDTHTDVIGRDSAGRLWLYPGNGKGGWGTRTQIGSGWQGFTSIFSPGDFNGDTHTDVIGRDSAGRLWLYPGNGKGGWGTRTQIGSGWQGFTSLIG